MYCFKCGKEIMEDSTFCPLCGADLAKVASPQTRSLSEQKIPDYLPWAIAATLLCCVPGGIVSIIYSNRATKAKDSGDIASAQEAANKAKMWLIISAVTGLIVGGFIILANM